MQSDEKKSGQSYERQNVVPCERAGSACSILSETLPYNCTVRNFKHLILHVSVFEGDIFANVSTPGEKLLLLYIVLD